MRKLSSNVQADCFSETEYFLTDIARGVTTNPQGKRIISLSEDFLSGFREALVDECGPAANEVLYSCGKMTGDLVGVRLSNEISEFYGQSVHTLGVPLYDTILHSYFSHHGWGYFHSDYSSIHQGLIVIEFENSIFQSFLAREDRPLESLLAGLLSGIYSQVSGQDLECLQTDCSSLGSPKSRFVLGLKERIEQVRPALESGNSHNEILDQLSKLAA